MSSSWLILIELMLSFIEAALRSGLPLPTGCLSFLHTNRESLEKSERAPYSFTRDGLKSFWRAAKKTEKKKTVSFSMFAR